MALVTVETLCDPCGAAIQSLMDATRIEQIDAAAAGERLPRVLPAESVHRVCARLLERRRHDRHRHDAEELRRLRVILTLTIQRETERLERARWQSVAVALGLDADTDIDAVLYAVDVQQYKLEAKRTPIPAAIANAFIAREI